MNQVTTQDSIFSPIISSVYQYLNNIPGPFWVSSTWVEEELVSTDNGATTFKTNDQVILGMFFFMNDFKLEHSRSVYNI